MDLVEIMLIVLLVLCGVAVIVYAGLRPAGKINSPPTPPKDTTPEASA